MLIENMMYFALGILVAALLSLIVMSAVWKRAVRLTKRRIEAATPITMAEFRADKDQLRAEFALSTRRLEMTIEELRQKVAVQQGEVNQRRTDMAVLKAERDAAVGVTGNLEARDADMRGRVQELERESADLAQRLRMRERELETRSEELDALRIAAPRDRTADTASPPLEPLGDAPEQIERLNTALAQERRRTAFLETEAQSLLARLETVNREGAEANAAIAQMREALARRAETEGASELAVAQARISGAEQRLNAILAASQSEDAAPRGSLAQELNDEEQLERLRTQVLNLQSDIAGTWEREGFDEAALRQRLVEMAGAVSRLVYAADGEVSRTHAPEESLFDRIQRFADEEDATVATGGGGAVSERMQALREIQER